MADPSDKERLAALEARIAAAKPKDEPPAESDHFTQGQVAWRMVTELVAGLGIGLGIGMGLDAVLGTKPFMLVLFVFLGFAAGVRVMMRTAQEVQRGKQAEETAERDEGR